MDTMPSKQSQISFPVRKSSKHQNLNDGNAENTQPLSQNILHVASRKALALANETTPSKRRPKICSTDDVSPSKLRRNKLPFSPRENDGNVPDVPFKTKARKQLLSDNLHSQEPPQISEPIHETLSLSLKTDAFEAAKHSLNTQQPDKLICRDAEINKITLFLDTHFASRKPSTSGSLYISGAPGTGKTAVIKHLLSHHKQVQKHKSIFINSMTIKTAHAMYKRLAGEIIGEKEASCYKSVQAAKRAVERELSKQGPKMLLVLDEMDQLDSKHQEVLYSIFEWPTIPHHRLVLIGIANALDLTDRILPRLSAKARRPELLNFLPYTKDQIVDVLQSRLHQGLQQIPGSTPVLDNAAVMFCARKVSAVAGDMRKALDICRRSIEVTEIDSQKSKILQARATKKSCLIQSVDLPDTPSTSMSLQSIPSINALSKVSAPKSVSLIQVSEVVNEVYGGTRASANNSTFPLQQKLIVCSILLLLKSSKLKDVPVVKAYSAYSKVCKKRDVQPCDQSEFSSLCSLLETRGLITIKKAKEARLNKLMLKMDAVELESALQDKLLISCVLESGL